MGGARQRRPGRLFFAETERHGRQRFARRGFRPSHAQCAGLRSAQRRAVRHRDAGHGARLDHRCVVATRCGALSKAQLARCGPVLQDLTLEGHDDWRLPTRLELVSIVDFAAYEPAIDRAAFPGTPAFGFWSGSLAPRPGRRGVARVLQGGVHELQQSDYLVAVALCTERPPARRWTHRSAPGRQLDGTVKDTDTGLTWKQSSEPDRYTFEAARTQCEGLDLRRARRLAGPEHDRAPNADGRAVVPADNGDAASTRAGQSRAVTRHAG